MVGIQEPPGIEVQHVAITSGAWAPFLNEHVPDVKEAFRITHANHTLEIDGEVYSEVTYYAEGRIAYFFGLPLICGGDYREMHTQPNTARGNPNLPTS